jgi:hypothetical protein
MVAVVEDVSPGAENRPMLEAATKQPSEYLTKNTSLRINKL